MKQVLALLFDILPLDLQDRLSKQPDGATEYAEKGFSISILTRVPDRLKTAKKRLAFVKDPSTRQNLNEIVGLLEDVLRERNAPVWQGYFVHGSNRIEFVLVPCINRRVMWERHI